MRLGLAITFPFLFLLQDCTNNTPSKKDSIIIDHAAWSLLLQNHVNKHGYADYRGFLKDSLQLNTYLDALKNNPPDENNWSVDDQLAYWINAYNAFTVKLIIDHYPLASIKDIGSGIQIPFVNSPWDIKFIDIQGEKMDLNTIEHSILRKKFNEPRIHFAINCASISCPKLRKEAYLGEKLNDQLNDQARNFINDSTRNLISERSIELSSIFNWFKGDFTKNGSLIEFLNSYSNVKIDNDAKVSFMNYDWSLNVQH